MSHELSDIHYLYEAAEKRWIQYFGQEHAPFAIALLDLLAFNQEINTVDDFGESVVDLFRAIENKIEALTPGIENLDITDLIEVIQQECMLLGARAKELYLLPDSTLAEYFGASSAEEIQIPIDVSFTTFDSELPAKNVGYKRLIATNILNATLSTSAKKGVLIYTHVEDPTTLRFKVFSAEGSADANLRSIGAVGTVIGSQKLELQGLVVFESQITS